MSTSQLDTILQALADHPYDRHMVIANMLGISSQTVTTVCKESDIKCEHGTKSKVEASFKKRSDAMKAVVARRREREEADRAAGLLPPKYATRSALIKIDKEDWNAFGIACKVAGVGIAQQLGNLIREFIDKSNSHSSNKDE